MKLSYYFEFIPLLPYVQSHLEIAKDGKSFWLSCLEHEPWKSKVKNNAIFTFNI